MLEARNKGFEDDIFRVDLIDSKLTLDVQGDVLGEHPDPFPHLYCDAYGEDRSPPI